MQCAEKPEASTVFLLVVGLCALTTSNINLEKVVAAAVSTVLAKHTPLTWKYTFLLLAYEIIFFPAFSVLRYNVNNWASLSFAPYRSITL